VSRSDWTGRKDMCVENCKVWVGVDLGAAGHQVCVVNRERNILLERKSKHEGASTAQLIDELLGLVDGAAELIGVAVETPQSAIAEALLDRGLRVYSINPKQLDRLRDGAVRLSSRHPAQW
jgi:transposase